MSDGVLEAPAGTWLVPFLLLFLRDGGSHGDELEERLGASGIDGMHSGETYRTLWQMEQKGLVSCDRQGDEYRLPRRQYQTTGLGEAYLEFWANSLARYREEIDLFLGTYTGAPAKGISTGG